jgi:hypothetical protein
MQAIAFALLQTLRSPLPACLSAERATLEETVLSFSLITLEVKQLSRLPFSIQVLFQFNFPRVIFLFYFHRKQ